MKPISLRSLLRSAVQVLADRARTAAALCLVGGTFALGGTAAHAQALDEIRMVGDGADAVLQIRFNVRVQYQRHAPLEAADLIEVYFQLVGNDEALTRPIEETMTVKPQEPAPGASVTYPVQSGLPVKKIVIRLGRKAEFRVRAGKSNQLLEIIFPGLAPSNAQNAPPPVAPPIVERDRYAISLQSVPLSESGSLRAVPARLQDYAVFGSQEVRNGTTYYEVLLGYFDSQDAAQKVVNSILADFPNAKVIDIVQRKEANLENAAKNPPPETAPAPAAAPPPPAEPTPAPAPPPASAAPVPAEAAAAAGAAAGTAAAAGSAATAAAGAAAGETAGAAGGAATGAAASAAAGAAPGMGAGAAGATPAPVAAPSAAAAAAAAVAAAPETDLDKQGAALMSKSRTSLIAGRNEEALNTLNQLLLLPPNKYSQDAQELVGLARERAGDLGQARKEYELYLRLFPTGDGATRVRQRLATLAPPELSTTTAAKPPEKHEPQMTYGGSVSSYYYGGKENVQTTFLNVPVTVNQQTISNTTQSSLVTTADLNGRYRTDAHDTRIVFRDSDQRSFISDSAPSLNRMDAAYVDYRSLQHGYEVKLGRQTGVTGGLVGRFDGAIVNYELLPKLRVEAVAGVPVSQDQFVNAHQRFEGLSMEAQNFAEHWGASGFVINQSADGVVDRRAVGGEVRYFDQQKTLYTLVDYDVQFATLNAATIQGTYQLPDQTSIAVLLDDRKAPTLETANGLLQAGCPSPPSYADYFAGRCTNASAPYTVDKLRADALQTTANSHVYSLDVSHPVNKNWQVSGDIRLTSVGALPTVTLATGQTFQGSSATGNVLSMTAQASGSNLYSKRDINVFSVTHLRSPTLTGNQLSLSNLNGLLDNRLTLEPNLSLYRESDTTGQKLFRISPSFRTSYKLTRRFSAEGTIAMERSRNEGPAQNDTTTNVFYYAGFRYDLTQ